MIPPKRLIVTAVVAAFVTDNPEKLIPLATKNPTEGQTFREGHLGDIFWWNYSCRKSSEIDG